jgi:ribosome-associated translation inhibitor RaiA
MEIVMQLHHATVTDTMREKIEAMVENAAKKLPRVVDATIRLEEDGTVRRVEVMLHAPKQPSLVATAEGRYFGPLVSEALLKLGKQMAREKKTPKARARAYLPKGSRR